MAKLPATIEAMFLIPSSKEKDVAYLRDVHRNFLQHYQLSEDDGPPILMYDPRGARSMAPFSMYEYS